MTGLMALSFLLHVISLYFIFQLRNERAESRKQLSRMTEDIEETLASFSADMMVENEKILESISKMNNDRQPSSEDIPETYYNEEEEIRISDNFPDGSLSADQERIIQLANEGLDSTEIAKVMNKGKGEVDLLLKFYR
ncbi:DUF6115 domain-containing protein [Fictibacillus aquaticus]|uniref:Swarming motility protein SwrB n=1 Tax=Fictibacillus aquaticus TaxID=2021314 RepID=A0A235FC77_9BACL|nr:hypothetical protein [Fictibacillus aquaticus]OYD58832.1 hypothetical protein CGZ90_02720 [Fictibacillus aquaticus]